MTKLEEFKEFVSTIPSIRQDVLNGRYSWQQLYELYDMYGKDDKFWMPYKNQSNGLDFMNMMELVKGIDVDALTSSLSAIEKVLTMASGFFVKEQTSTDTRTTKWYDE